MASLVEGNTRFAVDLYRTLVESEQGNLFLSPYSISLALAMAYAGARGETEAQMADSLSFELPQDKLHSTFNALDLALSSPSMEESESPFQLNIANSVWGQQQHGFLPDYLDVLAVDYGEKVREVDFKRNPEQARLSINGWASEETDDLIRNLIPPDAIDRYTRLVLSNAIYFKASWQNPFVEEATSDRPFYLLDGGEVRVPMMSQQEKFGYFRGEGYQAVELPYAGGDIVMTILLPDSGTFSEFEEAISANSLASSSLGLESRLLMLSMPKIDIESSFSLPSVLEVMGMVNAFDDKKADFSGIDGRSCIAGDDECLLISDVLHKAFVTIDEEGTEAAAATAVVIGVPKSVIVPEEPIKVTVDRPFLFAIRDLRTGTILFLGRVLNPLQ